jgi:hypothetical protein
MSLSTQTWMSLSIAGKKPWLGVPFFVRTMRADKRWSYLSTVS